MSCSYVCLSCRLQLSKQVKSPSRSQWLQKATFVSLDAPQTGTERGTDSSDTKPDTAAPPHRGSTRRLPLSYDRTVEEDFLERLYENRDLSSAPYSNPRPGRNAKNIQNGRALSKDLLTTQQQGHQHRKTKRRYECAQEIATHPSGSITKTLRSQIALNSFGLSSEKSDKASALSEHHHVSQRTNNSSPKRQTLTDTHLRQPLQQIPKDPSPNVQGLERLVHDSKTSAEDCYRFYLTLITTHVEIPLSVLDDLTRKVVHSWCQGRSEKLPRPHELLKGVCSERSAKDELRTWKICAWNVILHTVRSWKVDPDGERGERSLTELLQGLVALWNTFLETHAECHVLDSHGTIRQVQYSKDWEAFTNSEQMARIRKWFDRDFVKRLALFLPTRLHIYIDQTDAIGLSTFLLLQKYCGSVDYKDKDFQQESMALSRFIGKLVASSDVLDKMSRIEEALLNGGLTRDDADELIKQINTLALRPVSMLLAPDVVKSNDPASLLQKIEVYHNVIGGTGDRRNGHKLELVWRDAQETFSPQQLKDYGEKVYLSFLRSFMACDRPNRAIEIWNHMIQHDVTPSVVHWDAMLTGCGAAGAPEAIQGLWRKMLSTGLKPDAVLWCTRIHGLLRSQSYQSAVNAFQEMARLWLSAASSFSKDATCIPFAQLGDIDGNVKPNEHHVSTMVSGLARGNKYDQIPGILSLAKSLGIKLNVYTFNPLFERALSEGNTELAMRLLRQMQKHDIVPNVATFTLMIHSVFRNPNSVAAFDPDFLNRPPGSSKCPTSPADAKELMHLLPELESGPAGDATSNAVRTVFAMMHQCSIQPSARTYTALVCGLLGSSPPDVTAAYAIYRHLSAKRLPISANIYTSLTDFHFNQQPPNLDEVARLWTRAVEDAMAGDSPQLDTLFYERLVRGYCRHGCVSQAIGRWRAAKRGGHFLSWEALTDLVGAAAAACRWEAVAQVAEAVKAEEEQGGPDKFRRAKGRLQFWQLVEECQIDGRWPEPREAGGGGAGKVVSVHRSVLTPSPDVAR